MNRVPGPGVLVRVRVAESDTLAAEYVALATLQADALVTLDDAFARSVAEVVPTVPYAALFD